MSWYLSKLWNEVRMRKIHKMFRYWFYSWYWKERVWSVIETYIDFWLLDKLQRKGRISNHKAHHCLFDLVHIDTKLLPRVSCRHISCSRICLIVILKPDNITSGGICYNPLTLRIWFWYHILHKILWCLSQVRNV